MNEPLLWHVPISHFDEKVRAALGWRGIPHRRHHGRPAEIAT